MALAPVASSRSAWDYGPQSVRPRSWLALSSWCAYFDPLAPNSAAMRSAGGRGGGAWRPATSWPDWAMKRPDNAGTICLLAMAALFAALLSATAVRAENSPPAPAPAPAAVPAPAPAAVPAPATAPAQNAAGGAQATQQQTPDSSAPPARGLFPAQPPAPGAASDKPGFFHQFGKWWDDSIADFNAKMKDAHDKFEDLNKKQSEAAKESAAKTQEAMKNAAQATKDAASAMVRLPNTYVVELHDRCPMAANGAPDCQTTATTACNAKGFTTGKPADVQSSQQCP